MISRKLRLDSLCNSARLIDPELLALEASLNTTKWFANRFLSPERATRLFAELYREQCKSFVARYIDEELVPRIRGVDIEPPAAPSREYTQLWKARQRADEVGLPYDQYLIFCFEFSGRRQRNSPIPRPNQLHANDATATAWWAEFEKFALDRSNYWFDTLEMPAQYSIPAFKALPAQVAFREHVIERAQDSGAEWPGIIDRLCFSNQFLPTEDLRSVVGEELFDHSLEVLRGRKDLNEHVPVELRPDQLWQSCFGVPGAQNPLLSSCSSCPQANGCALMAGLIVRQLEWVTGSTEPLAEARKKKQRDRTRRSREKKKLLAAGGFSAGVS